MPKFLDEAWFWAGLYGILGSALTLFITEVMRRKGELNLERLRLYDTEILAAHKKLYIFATDSVLRFFPPENPKIDFAFVMREDYFKNVKPNLLLFSSDIREILHKFEAQFHCLGDEDLIPDTDFDTFIDTHFYKDLGRIQSLVEKRADVNLKKLR